MTSVTGANREFRARMDKIKMSIIDSKRALRNIRDGNDHTNRIKSIENTLDEIPTSNGALPTEEEHAESLNGKTLLESLEQLAYEIDDINKKESRDPERINETLEKADQIQNEIQDMINTTNTA